MASRARSSTTRPGAAATPTPRLNSPITSRVTKQSARTHRFTGLTKHSSIMAAQPWQDPTRRREGHRMILYHGSNVEVRLPRILTTNRSLDFGAGFYTTSSPNQAERWAQLQTRRRRGGRATKR
ncbi:DUF3990 domain-containing protein [Adlercreutzia equolifaciens]|uniref:DUF3990 domain-containing protein n=1 Tax=Adlercreutzia equolifaciens TaxID=446660 RepID=UPI003AEF40EA